MSQTLSETIGYEKLRSGLSASAATVGRPAGVGGKRIPHRSKMTKKEIEKLNTKGMKAGGPGSGRKPSGEKDHEAHQQRLIDRGRQIMEGPGSGRHPGYGGFKRTTNNEKTNTDSWEHKGTNTKVHVTDIYNKHADSEKTFVHEQKVLGSKKKVFSGNTDEVGNFLKSKYGIDQNK